MTTVQAPRTRGRSGPSTFALKQTMAVTGVIFVGFVVVHMIGNLKVYSGEESLNDYATWLRHVGHPLVPEHGVLWALRVVLLVALVAHVTAALMLWTRGRRARGKHRTRGSTASARTAAFMLPGGILIAAFVLIHLLDLTIGRVVAPVEYLPPDPDGTVNAHANLVASFSRPWMAIIYSVTMLVVAVHVEHGIRTLLQDLGATGRRLRKVVTILGGVIALAIVLGNGLIPILVLAGVIA